MSLRFALTSHQLLLRGLMREHIVGQFGGQLVAEFESVQQLRRESKVLDDADLLLIDGDMEDASLMPVLRQLLRRRPSSRIILMTDLPAAYLAEVGVRLGVRGLVHKRDSLEALSAAITTVGSGGLYISPKIDLAGRRFFSRILSERELSVLTLQATGLSLAAVARALKLAPSTVLTHRRNYMRKIGSASQLDVALFAVRSGLVPISKIRGKSLSTSP